MKKMILSTCIILLSLSIYSCNNLKEEKPADAQKSGTETSIAKKDTLGNDLKCNIVIDGKKFNLPADSISTSFADRDSSLKIFMKGLDGGRIILDIPNLFECPCKIPTGYQSAYTKIFNSEEYAIVPTVELYDYPVADFSLRNLDDGFHKIPVSDNAATITVMQKISENINVKKASFLIKGSIHTTVLKNAYESHAGSKNKDYKIEGDFVINAEIYF